MQLSRYDFFPEVWQLKVGHDTLIRCSTLHQSTARVGIFTCGPAVQVGDNAMLPASAGSSNLQEAVDAIWIHPVDLELFF